VDELAETTPTTRLGGRDPAPGWIVALAVIAIAFAVLKPWAGEAPGAAPRVEGSPTGPPATSSEPRPERADLRLHCHEPSGWRVYAHQRWKRGYIRTWSSLQPAVSATGPLDERLPVVRVPDSVTALGYCAPWEGTERPPADAELSVWLVLESERNGGAVAALRLVHLAPEEDTTLGGLYEPAQMGLWFGDPYAPRSPAPTPAPWPVNRYVFALRAEGWERWWIVRVGGQPAGNATPAPRS
jgi:hypothetical protein